jgi:excinuclease ABC subunit B
MAYNTEHGIDPQTVRKRVTDILLAMDLGGARSAATPDRRRRRRGAVDVEGMPREEMERLVRSLEEEMHEAAKDLRFEYAARLRDEVQDLRKELAALRGAGVG